MAVHTFRDVIALFKPMAALAEACDTTYARVVKWKVRDYIPPEYWPDIIKAARYLGHKLTADDLMRCAKKRQAA